ncbi:aminotransferase class I/II-fold pyridoxal phosphate-dependent enzyme [Sphingomonas sp. RIT328]|uniref:aminotransferase class I/II-fold pyridoxal phosphate-dependent enzyme n=1 Tax=Sphingomonas sp. RIT328 TaxID=1470591 RepID=UPI00044F6AC7|nr:aminotransferase class I/II-fold pyridoxal phosphate-dependent enzyme [Sphingomonas sp. RIT328]EZP49982.1 2-amino-3-ketobutyrate CoA ligase [Sphingomonas sp. RIT328]
MTPIAPAATTAIAPKRIGVSTIASPVHGTATINGAATIMLGSNNYLGLAGDPAVAEAAIEALRRYGVGTGINPCFARTPVQLALETELADHLGVEDALLFASCSAANAGVLTTLAGPGELILSDRMNHASIIDGCRLSRASTLVYDYSSPASLAAAIETRGDRRAALIITDGVFSMEGDVAPLSQLAALAEAAGAVLVVDDSHGTGVVGPNGRGSAAACGVDPARILFTGTFSKALGGAPGGFAAGSRKLVEWLRLGARPFIFTTGMGAADAAAALAALRALRSGDGPFDRLHSNARLFRSRLRDGGMALADSPSPITPLPVGDEGRARRIHSRLLEEGVFVPVMAHPIVARGDARLRAQPSAALSVAEIEYATDAILDAFEGCR